MFRLTESLKDGGLENSLEKLGLNEGTGSEGELTEEQINSPLQYDEDEDCKNIEENLSAANNSLESALPGKYHNHFNTSSLHLTDN